MTVADPLDREVRLRAFDFLNEQTSIHGDVLPWSILSTGFLFNGARVPLVGPRWIFKPAILPEVPLSIATAPVREAQASRRLVVCRFGAAWFRVLRPASSICVAGTVC